MKCVALALLVVGASGHAMMYEPSCRTTGFNNGAFIGCPKATGRADVKWEECTNPARLTNPFGDRTYGTIFYNKWMYCLQHPVDCSFMWLKGIFHNVENRVPWRAPGSAPTEKPCGLMGGAYVGIRTKETIGFALGWNGTEVAPLLKETTWIAGSTVEVAWQMTANHGGGYQYRLCRLKEDSANVTEQVSEECFQKTPLEFVGKKQWIQFQQGKKVVKRTAIPAVRLTKGVLPKGSIWTRNPIPGCNDVSWLGGIHHKCSGPMFKPPIPGLYGIGPGARDLAYRDMNFAIVDLVEIPEKLPDGDYILSFRWDCEQVPQVLGSCADVRIKAKGIAKPTKALCKRRGCLEAFSFGVLFGLSVTVLVVLATPTQACVVKAANGFLDVLSAGRLPTLAN